MRNNLYTIKSLAIVLTLNFIVTWSHAQSLTPGEYPPEPKVKFNTFYPGESNDEDHTNNASIVAYLKPDQVGELGAIFKIREKGSDKWTIAVQYIPNLEGAEKLARSWTYYTNALIPEKTYEVCVYTYDQFGSESTCKIKELQFNEFSGECGENSFEETLAIGTALHEGDEDDHVVIAWSPICGASKYKVSVAGQLLGESLEGDALYMDNPRTCGTVWDISAELE